MVEDLFQRGAQVAVQRRIVQLAAAAGRRGDAAGLGIARGGGTALPNGGRAAGTRQRLHTLPRASPTPSPCLPRAPARPSTHPSRSSYCACSVRSRSSLAATLAPLALRRCATSADSWSTCVAWEQPRGLGAACKCNGAGGVGKMRRHRRELVKEGMAAKEAWCSMQGQRGRRGGEDASPQQTAGAVDLRRMGRRQEEKARWLASVGGRRALAAATPRSTACFHFKPHPAPQLSRSPPCSHPAPTCALAAAMLWSSASLAARYCPSSLCTCHRQKGSAAGVGA